MTQSMHEILLVEDNPGDVRLFKEALKDGALHARLQVARNGEEAIAYLRGIGAGAPYPDLVLLDLHMPRKGGLEVLQEIKQDPVLSSIPVIVLTSSNDPYEADRSAELKADLFITKPTNLSNFRSVVALLEEFCAKREG